MKKIKFAIAQMNPTVGDFAENSRKIIRWIQEADKKKADLIVFPEIALSGYPVWDLANKKSFIAKGRKFLQRIIQATKSLSITAVLGYIEQGEGADSRSRNAMAWITRGRQTARYYKRLLPTYDVFLEDIFFRPGESSDPISWKGIKVGPTICEDIWDARYPIKPLAELTRRRSNLILNISASPYYRGVAKKRDQLVMGHAKRHQVPMLYVNQVGGQDDLIFDGRSFFADAKGQILFRAPAFHEGLFYFDWNPDISHPYEVVPPFVSIAEVHDALVLGVRDYCRKNGFKKVVIGLSGGIDSALVAALAVEALGPRAVLGVTMPGPYSSKGSWKDSEDLAHQLGIEIRTRPIKQKYEMFMKQEGRLGKKTNLAAENLQARLRGLELMFISNDEGRLVLTTGNKSELAMGYCTLYGDMAGGLAVIGDVYKTDVYRLSWYVNREREIIPKAILNKAPSAELRPNQKDEDSLPPYEVLDQILYLYIEKNKTAEEIVASIRHCEEAKPTKQSQGRRLLRSLRSLAMTPIELVQSVMNRVDHNEYKRRQTPPILRVTEKAWFGRRMPITNRFQH